MSAPTADERLEAIGVLVRTIVDLDLRDVPVERREVLTQHLTGALFVFGERPYALPGERVL